MDNMLEENKNLKDSKHSLLGGTYGTGTMSITSLSYTKTNKLVSALYMVTDIMDKEEPLRNKLRILGTNIISDIHLFYKGQDLYIELNNKISEVLAFLEIASSVSIISEMNCNILTKEFIQLRNSIIKNSPKNEENWLEEFLSPHPDPLLVKERGRGNSIGHSGTRIGVQKGSTLLHALSRIEGQALSKVEGQTLSKIKMSDRIPDGSKTKRREEIIFIIKDKMKNSVNFDGATITDIKSNGHEMLASCGEKTLQRELVSMVLDGVLKKTGSKRWSRYSINN
jgi:hypothetical protein